MPASTHQNDVESDHPSNWPLVDHIRYIPDALSFQTAAVAYSYPFGRMRCIRRMWLEQALKGAQKPKWRINTQTSRKDWNVRYTSRIETALNNCPPGSTVQEQRELVNQWVMSQYEEMKLVEVAQYWNKAHPSVYSEFCCLELIACRRKPDDVPMQIYISKHLDINIKPADLKAFLVKVTPYAKKFSNEQVTSLKRLEWLGMKYNPGLWPISEKITWSLYGFLD